VQDVSFRSFLASLFKDVNADENGVKQITVNQFRAKETEFAVDAYAIFTVIDFVAALMSNIELQTYYKNELQEGREWYRLNVKPNLNQNAKDFWKEFWCKLLYYQEVLVVPIGEQLIIADDFVHHPEYAVKEDVFEQVSRGDYQFRKQFKSSEVFYMRYSTVDINTTLMSVMKLYGELVSHAAEVYSGSGGEKGILNVNSAAAGPEDFEQKYGAWINSRFKSYFSASNAVMPLFRGMTYSGKHESIDSESSENINNMLDAALMRVANAYKVPPAVLRGEVAGMSDAFNVFLTSCVDPLASMLATELTAKEFDQKQASRGNRIKAFTNNIKHTDIFEVATNFDKLFADGFSHNELCRLLGMPEINEEWANRHYITKNYADAANPDGEEVNEDDYET
jgi:HK97 family phage portal protein